MTHFSLVTKWVIFMWKGKYMHVPTYKLPNYEIRIKFAIWQILFSKVAFLRLSSIKISWIFLNIKIFRNCSFTFLIKKTFSRRLKNKVVYAILQFYKLRWLLKSAFRWEKLLFECSILWSSCSTLILEDMIPVLHEYYQKSSHSVIIGQWSRKAICPKNFSCHYWMSHFQFFTECLKFESAPQFSKFH